MCYFVILFKSTDKNVPLVLCDLLIDHNHWTTYNEAQQAIKALKTLFPKVKGEYIVVERTR